MVRVGFVGSGNMGLALVASLLGKGMCKPEDIVCSDKIPAALERAQKEYHVQTTTDVAKCVAQSSVVFLSVKPQDVEVTLKYVKQGWAPDKILVSICAGVQLVTLERFLGQDKKIVRVMPNTPAMVGAMAAGFACNSNVEGAEAQLVDQILGSAGVAFKMPEDSIDAVTGLSGSGPAYVAYLVREFATAGELVGLPADVSYGLALQTFAGTAKLLGDKKITPDALIKMVTSPNGTTWAGRQVLEKSNAADIIKKTVLAGTVRSKELGAAAALKAKQAGPTTLRAKL
jgi:pyrroline-5-carboxylate reductase